MKNIIQSVLILAIVVVGGFFLLHRTSQDNKAEDIKIPSKELESNPFYSKNKATAMKEIQNDYRLGQDGENLKITKEYIPTDCQECLSLTYEYNHYGMEDIQYKVHLLMKNGKVLDSEDQGRTKQENSDLSVSYWEGCTRDVPERVLNKQKVSDYEFALNNEDGRGVEIASLADGVKLTVKNEGCISYSLAFEFTFPQDKQHPFEDEKYWQKRAIDEMSKITTMVDSPISIDKGVKMLRSRASSEIPYEETLYIGCSTTKCDNEESLKEQVLKESMYLKRLGYDPNDGSVTEAIYFSIGEL